MREGLRLYLLGLLVIVFIANVPEVRTIIQDNAVMAAPKIKLIQQTLWDRPEAAQITALLNKIAPDTILINNTPVQLDKDTDFALTHGPSITADQADTILREIGSPATGQGSWLLSEGKRTNIDPAYVLAMCIHESGCGTNPNWAGYKSKTDSTHNSGNIICYGDLPCYGRFVDYPSWKEGFSDHFDLLALYRDKDKLTTIDAALNKWAPPVENDTNQYTLEVKRMVSDWRELNKRRSVVIPIDGKLHPVTATQVINAHFTDKNCTWWGFQAGCQHFGTDYRLDDNEAVYLPVTSAFIIQDAYPENTALAGQYVMFRTNNGYELYFGHLKRALTANAGDIVAAGTIIGYGRKDLLHTHVQVRDPQGNLMDFEDFYKQQERNL